MVDHHVPALSLPFPDQEQNHPSLHESIPWEDVEDSFRVIRNLIRRPEGPPAFVEDWISQVKENFEEVWDNASPQKQQVFLTELKQVPFEVFRDRYGVPRQGVTAEAGLRLALPSVENLCTFLGMSYLRGIQQPPVRFQVTTRRRSGINIDQLDTLLAEIIQLFPVTRRKYDFLSEAKSWVENFKKSDIYTKWGSYSEDQQRAIADRISLNEITNIIAKKRSRKVPIRVDEILPSLDTLKALLSARANEEQHRLDSLSNRMHGIHAQMGPSPVDRQQRLNHEMSGWNYPPQVFSYPPRQPRTPLLQHLPQSGNILDSTFFRRGAPVYPPFPDSTPSHDPHCAPYPTHPHTLSFSRHSGDRSGGHYYQ